MNLFLTKDKLGSCVHISLQNHSIITQGYYFKFNIQTQGFLSFVEKNIRLLSTKDYSVLAPHLIRIYSTCPGGRGNSFCEWLSMIHKLQASILKCHFYWSPFDVPFAFPGVHKLCLWHFSNSKPWKSKLNELWKKNNQMKYQLNKIIWMHIN